MVIKSKGKKKKKRKDGGDGWRRVGKARGLGTIATEVAKTSERAEKGDKERELVSWVAFTEEVLAEGSRRGRRSSHFADAGKRTR